MTHKSYFRSGPGIWHIKNFELLAKDAWGFEVPKAFLYFFIWVVSKMRSDHRMGLKNTWNIHIRNNYKCLQY